MLQYTLTGRLTADPEISAYGPDNTPLARIRVASNQPGSNETDFFDVALFGDQALAAIGEAHKGDRVEIKGHARQSTWTTDAGEKRQRIALTARHVEHTPLQRREPPVATVDRAAERSAAR